MSAARSNRSRRGRLPADERERRQEAILDHALEELLDGGFTRLSMLGVARRAGASKETLYSWFGDRDGLLTALIERNGDLAAARVRAALGGHDDPRSTLAGFAAGLLALLTGESSVALNRAAMSSPELAQILLRSGRHRIGPLVEEYLTRLHDEGVVHIPDPPAAFGVLYGLVIQDHQIRVLLGESAPTSAAIQRSSELAVDRFFVLFPPADND